MSKRISFTLKSNVPAVTEDIERRLRRALDRIGIKWQAESKINISPGSPNAAVDTGRLRASIAFSTPNVQAVHSEAYPGSKSGAAGIVSYPVPKLDPLTVGVGTNVEYGAKVHEGIGMRAGPRKFIEDPMRANLDLFKRMTEEELAR